MGKASLDLPRGKTTFLAEPNALILIGGAGTVGAAEGDTHDGEEHPLWDKRVKQPPSKMLALDIIEQGILEPVIVRKNGTSIEVVAGRRRVKAARLANELIEEDPAKYGEDLVKVPCIERRGSDKELFGVVMSENAQREDLDALEQAILVQRALDRGLTEAEVAARLGVHAQTIKNRVQLLSACKEVKDAVRDGTLPATAALKLAVLDHDQQAAELAEMRASGNLSSERAARGARKRKNGKNGSSDTEYERPGKRLLKKIVEHENVGEAIDPQALRTLKWVLGLGSPTAVKGLSPLIASMDDSE